MALGLFAVGVLLLTLIEYGDSGRVAMPGSTPQEMRGERGSFLLEPRGIAYNSQGKLMYRWQSDAAERDSGQSQIVLTNLEYRGGMDRKRGWSARADAGQLSADGSQLQMTDNVVVTDLLRNLEIETQQIEVDLNRNRASSDTTVLLRTPRGDTTARGMVAMPDEGKLELKNNVQGKYNAG